MKKQIFLLASIAVCSMMTSCITSTIAAASGAGALGEAAGLNSLGLATLFSTSAPEALNGRIITLDGEFRGADNSPQKVSDALSFNKEGICTRRTGNAVQTLAYTRKDDKNATVASTSNTMETYRLAFTSGTEGTYTYERRGEDGDFATGEGRFSIK